MPDLTSHTISVHSLLSQSRANGPGRRAVVWLQGCTLNCPGCFNPETHDIDGGTIMDTDDLAREIISLRHGVEGITISGGEPFLQPKALRRLLAHIRSDSSLSVLIFSGYRRKEIEEMQHGRAILSMTDILIDGRYDTTLHLGAGLLASSNQRIHFLTDRYSPSDLEDTPPFEVLIDSAGAVTVTGINPPFASLP